VLRAPRRDECRKLCEKRAWLEKTLACRDVDVEKCVRICTAFALE
jgi:hypothetical protein